MELTLKERQKLTAVTAKKYRNSKKSEKTKILDTFIEQTGYRRKYAIHILANEGKIRQALKTVKFKVAHRKGIKRVYPRTYDKAVLDALILLWEAFNCQCGKLFAPFLHANIACICSDPHFTLTEEVTAKLRKISASTTVDRLLKPSKAALRITGRCDTWRRKGARSLQGKFPGGL